MVSYALDTALSLGATAAAVEVSEEKGTCVTVRNQETESIEHTHDRDFGITVYLGKSKAVASSGDFRKVSILRTVKAALDMARYTTPDECNGLPDKDRLCTNPRQLDLFHPWDISIEEQVQKAVEAEKAALDVDKRVVNSDGAMVTTTIGSFILGNTEGFLHGYPFSDHSIDTSVIAEDENGMQVGSWHTSGVSSMDLLSPQQVGMIAGQRAVDHLSARGLATRKCPVVFEAPVAKSLFRTFVHAASGSALYRKTSFLEGMLDKPIFPDHLSILENPFIPRYWGSAPFDDEGVRPSERLVVDHGVLSGLFLSSYSARKLGMTTTGNAGGPYNLIFSEAPEASEKTLSALLSRMGTGLLVTELIGQGVNYTTGDFSKGASGFWVENGRIVKAEGPAITAQCFRVACQDGHMAAVFMKFKDGCKPSMEQIKTDWAAFRGPAQELQLPSAPKQFLHYFEEPDRPQTRLDRMLERGMAVSLGRLREDTQYDYKFVGLSHNTLRGAAGGAVLLAELLCANGYIQQV